MDWGMRNRLNRIFQPKDGRAVMLAVDHGYFLGPISKLEEPAKTIEPLLPYADSLMLTRGVLRNCIKPEYNVPIILRVSGANSIAGGELSDEDIITSMEDAARLAVSAVALSVYVGTEHQRQTLKNLSVLIDEGARFGIPVLAVTAVGKELEKRDAKYLSLCCRICAELGAQMVKTYYCEDFSKIIKSCFVPVVIAGGPKLETESDVLNLVYNAISEGAAGVDMGRNVFQSSNPVGMIKAIRALVHDGATVKKAQMYSGM